MLDCVTLTFTPTPPCHAVLHHSYIHSHSLLSGAACPCNLHDFCLAEMIFENDKHINGGSVAGPSGLVLGQEYSASSLTADQDDHQQWFCPKCRENNVATSPVLTEEQKRDRELMYLKWLLIYSHTVRRWRLGCVVDVTPMGDDGPPAVYTVRWWRLDQKWAKTQLIDMTNSRILAASTYPPNAIDHLTKQQVKSEYKPSKGKEPQQRGRKRKIREDDGDEGDEDDEEDIEEVRSHKQQSSALCLYTSDGRRRRRRRLADGTLVYPEEVGLPGNATRQPSYTHILILALLYFLTRKLTSYHF